MTSDEPVNETDSTSGRRDKRDAAVEETVVGKPGQSSSPLPAPAVTVSAEPSSISPPSSTGGGESSEDFSAEEPEEPVSFETVGLPPKDLLDFAKLIVRGLALLAVFFALLSLCSIYWLSDIGQHEFGVEIMRTTMSVVTSTLPPIATLVLGFYFGKKQ